MRAVILGQSGQVATELQRKADRAGVSLVVLGREAMDLSHPSTAAAILDRLLPNVDVVINAAAYTAVDRAESEADVARAVNAEAPAALAVVAAKHGKPFIHISTDYVFDGSGTDPWMPDAPTAPLGVYGATKRDGEVGIRAAGGPHAILRTSWVFSSHGHNFVKTVLRLSRDRGVLSMVSDQTGGPTSAARIAGALFDVASAMTIGDAAALTGTYHFAGAPDVTWAEFAREIVLQAGIGIDVNDTTTSSYPTPATRPTNSRLDCDSLMRAFRIHRPDWRADLGDVLADLGITQDTKKIRQRQWTES